MRGAIGLLHQLAVDCPGGLEFLSRAAQVLTRLEELLVKFCYSSGELLVGELCEDALGEELVGDEACAFGLGQPVLEGADLLAEAMVLGAGVFQLGPQRRSGYPGRGDQVAGLPPGRLGGLELDAGLEVGMVVDELAPDSGLPGDAGDGRDAGRPRAGRR